MHLPSIKSKVDKQVIADSFSRAAINYDALAGFQHRVGERLLSFLPTQCTKSVDVVLDLGVGTGYLSEKLSCLFPAATLVQMDIAEGMLLQCRSRGLQDFQVQADIDHMPFRQSSVDIIFSNLSLQWCDQGPEFFANIYNILNEYGVAVMTTLVDGSLFELERAWMEVDEAQHINEFMNCVDLQQLCENSELKLEFFSVEETKEWFPNLPTLLNSIKGIGARNMRNDRQKGLMGKSRYQCFSNAYSAFSNANNELPLTYKVMYMVLRKVK